MKTHHGWRVSVCDVAPGATLARPWEPPPKVCDDFTVLAAALDCCQALDKAGRTGIELYSVERTNGGERSERLARLNWRRLAKAAA